MMVVYSMIFPGAHFFTPVGFGFQLEAAQPHTSCKAREKRENTDKKRETEKEGSGCGAQRASHRILAGNTRH